MPDNSVNETMEGFEIYILLRNKKGGLFRTSLIKNP